MEQREKWTDAPQISEASVAVGFIDRWLVGGVVLIVLPVSLEVAVFLMLIGGYPTTAIGFLILGISGIGFFRSLMDALTGERPNNANFSRGCKYFAGAVWSLVGVWLGPSKIIELWLHLWS